MKPVKEDVALEGDLTGQQFTMGIDSTSLAFLQKALTDLYTDPILAVIREYSSNAWDSHVAAGVTKPIDIKLPDAFSPFFVIQDYGVGMSVDDIRDIYSLYGASTKRNTNEQTGMLGLGCKSALTYTNQFTLIAVKNGMKSNVVISRNADGVGSMTVVSNTPVDEPNGVTVKIPVNQGDIREYRTKTQDFFKYWKKEQVLINDLPPVSLEGTWVSDDIFISRTDRYYGAKHKLVMGGVSYNIAREEIQQDSYGFTDDLNLRIGNSLVFFVEMGAVDFTPPREELHYTRRTRDKLAELREKFNEAIKTAAQKDIDNFSNHADVLKAIRKWNNILNTTPEFTYKGQKIPLDIQFDEYYNIVPWSNNRHDKQGARARLLDLVERDDVILVIGKPKVPCLTSNNKAKLRIIANEEFEESAPTFYFLEKNDYAPWTDDINQCTWNEVLNTKVLRNSSAVGSKSHWVMGRYGREVIKEADIDTTKTILYAKIKDIDEKHRYGVFSWAEARNCTLIVVAKNKLNSFKNKFPQAVFYRDWVKKEITNWKNGISQHDLEILGMIQHHNFNSSSFFDVAEIKDVELRRIARIAKQIVDQLDDPQSAVGKLRQNYNDFLSMALNSEVPNVMPELPNPVNVLDKYPLIGYIGRQYRQDLFEHIVLYINAVYDKEQANNAVPAI